ncbi:MAG: hypothetical protein U0903_15970 [Planctomycetales bacterium]
MDLWFFPPRGRRRSCARHLSPQLTLEGFESRCLLSAVMSHGKGIAAEVAVDDAHADTGKHKKHEQHYDAEQAAKTPKAPKFPDLSGQWRAITHAAGGDIIGVLQLTQHKKKLTGTLTNDGQPPGGFKAKIIVSDAPSSKLSAAAGATTQKQVKIQGKIENFAADSPWLDFETDFDPWDLPEPPDLPDPWDEPFDLNFDPPPDDWTDLPDLPDMELEPWDDLPPP